MPRHSKRQHQWMSGILSPDDVRDGIDNNPSRGAMSAIAVIVVCAALTTLVLHAFPYDVGKDVIGIITGSNETTGIDGNAKNANAYGTTGGRRVGKDAVTREVTTSDDVNDPTSSHDDRGQVVQGNGWSVTLPRRWDGETITTYSDDGNRAIVRTRGNGSGTVANDAANRNDDQVPYLLLIERVAGSEPDAYGDVGAQLAYHVTSRDGTWHLEVWTINAVWLARQDDKTPYEGTSEDVWDAMCDLLTGSNVDSADAARKLGDDDATIGTGEIDYLTKTLKPETQTE